MIDIDKTIVKRVLKTSEKKQHVLTVIDGSAEDLGKIFELSGFEQLIGRGEQTEIRLSDLKVSQKHALLKRKSARSGANFFYVVDNSSTNGTFVNGIKRRSCRLRNGDLIEVGDTLLRFSEAGAVEKEVQKKFLQQTVYDDLTKIFNRRMLILQLQNQFNAYRRYGREFALLMLDIDYFKQINDNFGHLAGDNYLQFFASRVGTLLRTTDIFGRYGGEEFLIISTETGRSGAASLAERILQEVTDIALSYQGQIIRTSVSCGITVIEPDDNSPHQVLQRADEALYQAKQRGRNCIVQK